MFSGVIILRIFSFLAPHTYPFSRNFILLAMFFSILPDLDAIWSKKDMDKHHESPFHTFLFWITASFILLLFSMISNIITIEVVFMLLVMVLAHLGFDIMFGRFSGVPILQPFTKKEYLAREPAKNGGNINPRHIHKKGYKELTKTYFEKKTLIIFEFSIWVVAVIMILLK